MSDDNLYPYRTELSDNTIPRCTRCGEKVVLGRILCDTCRAVPNIIVNPLPDAIGKPMPHDPHWPPYTPVWPPPGTMCRDQHTTH